MIINTGLYFVYIFVIIKNESGTSGKKYTTTYFKYALHITRTNKGKARKAHTYTFTPSDDPKWHK